MLNKDNVNDIDFYVFSNSRIEYLKKINKYGNAKTYNTFLQQLKSFRSNVNFSQINKSFIEQFKQYKKIGGLKNSSIHNYLRTFRTLYNQCSLMNNLENKKPFEGAFNDIKIKKRRGNNYYINYDSIVKLKNTNLKQVSYQRAIDFSLLRFYLCGIDFIDIYYAEKKMINRDRFTNKRLKLGDNSEYFDLKLFPEARTIIDKYKGADKKYLFDWSKDPVKYKTFRDNHNRDLNRAFEILNIEILPNSHNFTSKHIRHTFATLAKFKGIEPDIIRELMGHERDDVDTIYKDKYPEQVRDEAHEKIIYNLWLN